MKSALFSVSLRSAIAPAAVLLTLPILSAQAAEWTTTYGIMQLPDDPRPGRIRAPYSTDNGRIIGQMAIPKCAGCGPEIRGVWIENSSGEACETQKDGSKYWGDVSLTFTGPYNQFSGSWDYCGAGSTRSWTGSLGRSRSSGFQDR